MEKPSLGKAEREKNRQYIQMYLYIYPFRSCAKLAYEDAQGVIEGGHLSDTISTFHNQPRHAIESDILLLLDISKSLREKRYQDGALSLNSVKLSFELDASGIPIAVSPYEIKEANRLIEEFMLRANISVAHRVLQNYPGEALLRRHEEPNEKRLVRCPKRCILYFKTNTHFENRKIFVY